MLHKTKSFHHIHQTSVDLGPVPHEVVDGLDRCPSAHGSGAAWLVCKLQFINAKRDTKQEKNDPVKKFENKTAHSN